MAATTRDPSSPRKPLGPTGPALRTCPLACIAEDQLRVRRFCEALDSLAASGTLDRDLIRQTLRFLDTDLVPHMHDETDDLFPLLRRRCPAKEGIARALDRIGTDLDVARDCLPKVRGVLAACLEVGRGPTAPEADCLACFTRHTRRHLIAVKAILLPLARARLTPRDLQSLSLRLQARRGITPEPEDPYAF